MIEEYEKSIAQNTDRTTTDSQAKAKHTPASIFHHKAISKSKPKPNPSSGTSKGSAGASANVSNNGEKNTPTLPLEGSLENGDIPLKINKCLKRDNEMWFQIEWKPR
jgi:hypothetical protein